jgi:flagellin
MRIQHNIMAMNAYRNYNTNTSALSKNLEKLSSGYKINRAGDDAAGLAISEKMRAQITGLNAASKNVKDGISLVKTAEGAMQEIQDMLNRMDYLATQSANGTYDNETDRAALQKEVNQLRDEINRIADSANFNGIKLLDGSLEEGTMNGVKYTEATADQVKNMFVNTDWTGKTQLDVDAGKGVLETEGIAASKAGFQISLDNIGKISGGQKFNLTIGDNDTLSVELDAGDYTPSTLAAAIVEKLNGPFTYDGNEYNVTADGNTLKFESDAKAELKTAAKIGWYVGDEAPDATDTSVDYTASIANDALAAGDKLTIGGVDLDFDTDVETTVANYTGDYEVTYDKDTGVLTVKDPDGDLGKPAISYGAKGTDTPVNAEAGAVAGKDAEAATITSGTTKITTNTGTLTIDGEDVVNAGDFTGAEITGTTADGKYNWTVAADGTATITAATPGAAGNGTVSVDIDGAGANDLTLAGGVDAVTSKAEYDLTGFNAGSLTVGDQTVNFDTDLATTVAQLNSADFTFTMNGDKLVVEAKTAGAVAKEASAIGVKTNDAPAPTAVDVAEVETPKSGYINSGMQNPTSFNDGGSAQVANGKVDFSSAWSDGSKIKIGDTTYTVALGADSKFKNAANVVDLSDLEAGGTDLAKIAAQRLAAAAKDNGIFTVGHDGNGNTTLQQKTSVKESTDMSTVDKFASYLGVSTADAESLENAKAGEALTLQIGDTSDDFNQLKVSVGDMHTTALGIADIDIGNQAGAAAAVSIIKDAINHVSSVRGDLGAYQNRLEHTANNLSVMAENIQDAESTIRDTDVAEEMMSYVKNNILVQSAQAMLAQANQVPQGVLQLLG